MVLLVLVAAVLVGPVVVGWRALAGETGPHAADVLLLALTGCGVAAWLVS